MVHTNRFRSENNEDFLMSSQLFLFVFSCFFQYAWGACFNFLDLGDQFQISQFFRPKSSSWLRNPGAAGAACSAAGALAASEPHPATGHGGTIFFGSTNPQKPRGGGVCGDLSIFIHEKCWFNHAKAGFHHETWWFHNKTWWLNGIWMYVYEWEYHGKRSFGSENRVYWLPKWPFFKGENLKTMIHLRVAMGSLFSDTSICWVGEFLFSYWYIHYLGNPQIQKLNQIHIYLGRYCFWPPLSGVTLWIVRSKHDRICGLLRVIVLILPLTWLWKFDFDRKQPRMVDMFFFTFSQAALQEGCSWGRILTWLGEPSSGQVFFPVR